jgi:hypothetical protein
VLFRSSKAAEFELQQLRLQQQSEGTSTSTGTSAADGTATSSTGNAEGSLTPVDAEDEEPSPTSADDVCTSTVTGDIAGAPETGADDVTSSSAEHGGKVGALSMAELSALFENQKRSLLEQSSGTPAQESEAIPTPSRQGVKVDEGRSSLPLRSVFVEKTSITNWNGGFKG